jgi:hypothetical protein
MWCSHGNLMAHVEQSKTLSRKAKSIIFLFKATKTSETTKGAFVMVPDSLWNRNISVSLEKWFSVELELLCEIVWPVCWNVSDSTEMRKKWIRITWNTYFVIYMVTVQKLETFQTNSPLKHFDFFPFGTTPSDSSLNLKCFTLPNGA